VDSMASRPKNQSTGIAASGARRAAATAPAIEPVTRITQGSVVTGDRRVRDGAKS
jgi:hypothetical protein